MKKKPTYDELKRQSEKLQSENERLRHSETALMESEEKFNIIANQSLFGFSILQNGKYVYMNKAICDITGYTHEEVMQWDSRDFLKLIHPDDTAIVLKEVKKKLDEGSDEISHYEYRLIDKNGKLKWIENYSKAIIYKEKRADLIISADITRRKNTEHELIENEKKYRNLFENSPIGIGISDENGKIIDFNDATLKPGGYTREDINSLNSIDELHYNPDVRKRIIENLAKDGYINELEVRFKRKDGTPYTALLSMRPIQIKAKTCYLAIIQDITEQKKAEAEKAILEAQLQQAHKMEAIGTLAGGIAHDFNNILGIILSNTEVALLDVPENSRSYNHLKEICKAINHAKEIVRQILDFSRKNKHELKPVKLSEIIDKSILFIRSSIPSTIKITHNIKVESDVINADPSQINQIIINLCVNAAQAMMADGGILNISLIDKKVDENDVIKYPGLKPGKYLKLTVSDTGCGIKPEIINNIFDPYFTTKKVGEGTGMGLAVVRGIVKNHGGEIFVNSIVNHGTNFDIFFRETENKGPDKLEKKEKPLKGNENILYVEDDSFLIVAVHEMLKNLGYNVTACKNSLNALELFKSDPAVYDLIITDMTMPDMTGIILAQEIKKIQQDIPVILCTGYTDSLHEEEAYKIGINAFLMKPFGMNELARTIRQVLE